MQQLSFDLMETLNLVALAPCLFAIILLIVLRRFALISLVPILFFVALASSFIHGLQSLLFEPTSAAAMSLIWVESLLPALCFLLIIQLWRDRVPAAYYWLILALPVIGGSLLVIATLQLEEACLPNEYCFDAKHFRMLYQLFATALTFLLLTVHLGRLPIVVQNERRYQSHRYWLMIALIVSFTSLMIIDLFTLTGHISDNKNLLTHVILRLCFLYLVITSLFRLFDAAQPKAAQKEIDPETLDEIDRVMREEKIYRQMNVSREQCAQALNMPEHMLSRTLNQALGQNFNEFINRYRVEEAKQRLVKEKTSITAIAFEVGFSSIASFNRVFKAIVGKSPTEFRAQQEDT